MLTICYARENVERLSGDVGEGRVGEHRDAVRAPHLGLAGERGRDDLDSAAPEDVYRGNRLDVLESVREDYERLSRHS